MHRAKYEMQNAERADGLGGDASSGCQDGVTATADGFRRNPPTLRLESRSEQKNKITLNRKELPHLQCLAKILGDFQHLQGGAVHALGRGGKKESRKWEIGEKRDRKSEVGNQKSEVREKGNANTR
jgi:hypothetical protein